MALFRCLDESVWKTFVIELVDEERIKEARSLLKETNDKASKHVKGKVVIAPVGYNSPWSWHLNPTTISFAEADIEVCDSTIVYLEEHLDEVGGAYLPHNNFCPWSSRVIEEVEFNSSVGLRTLPSK